MILGSEVGTSWRLTIEGIDACFEHMMSVSYMVFFGSDITGTDTKITYTKWVSHLSGILWMSLCCMIPRRRICRGQHFFFCTVIKPSLCRWLHIDWMSRKRTCAPGISQR
jgi:hypothetical protein